MSKRAIEKAYVAYPLDATNRHDIRLNANRVGYQQGYEQAEKDTIERAAKWIMEFKNQLNVRFPITDAELLEQFRKEMGTETN